MTILFLVHVLYLITLKMQEFFLVIKFIFSENLYRYKVGRNEPSEFIH